MNKEKNFISAVIYIHNSASTIETFLRNVIVFFEEAFENSELICVNDFSTDNSIDIIKKVSCLAQSTTVSLINMSYFHGLEVAMNAGVDLAIGDYVYEFDTTDMDYSNSDIMNIYKKALDGYDIVSASSDKSSKLSSMLFYKLFSKYAVHSKTLLQTESFRILSRRVINRISHMNRFVPYRKVAYAYSGFKTINVRYSSAVNGVVHKRIDRQEKSMRRELAVDSLLLFTNIGYRFSLLMSALMLIMTVLVTIYTIIAYMVSTPAAGWTSTILFLALAFFGVFAVMAMVIKYLQLILQLVFRRQQYSFERIEKLTD